MIYLRFYVMFFALTNFSIVFGQGGKKMEALKKINSVSQAELYIQHHGPTSARIGNFSRLIDSIEYKEIEANYKVGDVFFGKKATYKILGNQAEPLFRCQYIVFDGTKMDKSKIDSLRSEIIAKFNAGIPFNNLANQFSMEVKPNGGDSGWFHKSRMGEAFCKDLTYKKMGDIFLFDNVAKNKYYIVLKTHAELYADSWVYVAM
jgi:hypothetical protein